jgi:putative transposase
LRMLAFKAAGAGKRVRAVDPASTSQTWSGGGRAVWKGFSLRWHHCPYKDGGVSLERDHNAALNVLAVGKAEKHHVGAGTAVGREREPLGCA